MCIHNEKDELVSIYVSKNEKNEINSSWIYYTSLILALLNSKKLKSDPSIKTVNREVHENIEVYSKYVFEIILTRDELEKLDNESWYNVKRKILSLIDWQKNMKNKKD